MTFAPDNSPRMGIPPVARTVLFWALMVVLAVVMWQMASKSPNEKSAPSMSYSDFMNNVDKNNVASARLLSSESTAEVEGELRQPPQKFKVTIPKEVIPDLTERLRKQGVEVYVSSPAPESNRLNLILNLAPIIIIAAIWFAMIRQRRIKREQSAPDAPPNRPIG